MTFLDIHSFKNSEENAEFLKTAFSSRLLQIHWKGSKSHTYFMHKKTLKLSNWKSF